MSKVILFTHPIYEHITDRRRKYKWCDNIRSFEKNIKPYGNNSSVIMPWNDTEHDRKFIECKCDVLDINNNDVETIDNQRFWGEWEQPSRVFKISNDMDKLKANFVHIPLFGKIEKNAEDDYINYQNYQNTDPYVFGDSFYYCCCKQNRFKYLKKLEEDDIIIFCGLLGNGDKRRFAIDTIFVVKQAICKYGTTETNETNKSIIDKLDRRYVNGVLNPVLFGNDESLGRDEKKYFVLYKAKMYKKDSVDELFSFFPVKKEYNYKKVEIPFDIMKKILHTDKTNVKISNRTQASIHEIDSKDVWNELYEYIVCKQNYLMGIKAYDEFEEHIIKGIV